MIRSQNLVRGLQHRAPVVDAGRVHEHVKPAERLGGVGDGNPGARPRQGERDRRADAARARD